jgi:hypothetical protein
MPVLLPGHEPPRPEPIGIEIQTRLKWPIPNELRKDLHPEVRKASIEMWKKNRPRATLRTFSGTYNCFGMVVACRRVWVGEPESLLRVFQDDGFRQLAGEGEVKIGDVIVYRNEKRVITHAGIVIGKNLFDPDNRRDTLSVLSKWGHEGEYEHDALDVPIVFGTSLEFWTDRRP